MTEPPAQKQAAKMWSGRFREPLNEQFESWQRSFPFDWRLLPEELEASRAHALALEAAGILTADERSRIVAGLDRLFDDHVGGFELMREYGAEAEDIHHFVELRLTEAIGDLALNLHTGRSRNEQIATDLRLYIRFRIQILLAHIAS